MSNVLVVEDNTNNMRLFRQILSDVERKLSVVEATRGEEALEKSKGKRFDLVIMDIALPDMDGIDTRKRLIQNENFKDTVFIAVTAHASSGDREELEKDFDYYISKPVDEEAMIALIEDILERGR